jgi:hypothetical protein
MNTLQKRSTTRKCTHFNISYNSVRVNGQQFTRRETVAEPRILFKPKKGTYYTILMYDLHSPKPAYLHYMAINITDPSSINPIVPYQPPSPSTTDTYYHVYMCELYEQPGFLTSVTPPPVRIGFDPTIFTQRYSLVKRAQRGFFINPRTNDP